MEDVLPVSKEQPKEQSATLRRFHRAVIWGEKLSQAEEHWQGKVRVNKVINIRMADGEIVAFQPGKDHVIGRAILLDLVKRATQEGCSSKRDDFYANDGPPKVANPLEIEIVEESLDPNFSGAYKAKGIPRL